MHDEFVDQARGQVLLPQGGPAHHADVPFPGGLACLGQSVLDPSGHEVIDAVDWSVRVGLMSDNEDRAGAMRPVSSPPRQGDV